MKKRILITRKLPEIAEEILSREFKLTVNEEERFLTQHELIEAVQTYDGILSLIPDKFSADVLKHATKLKVIANYAMGLDNIDLTAARKKEIIVTNTPDAVTESTADLTFALLLSMVRKIPEAIDYVKENKWKGWEPLLLLGEELRGKTFGIIGYGRIGRAVAKRARAFGLDVVIHHRRPLNEDVPQLSLDEFYAQCDYISLHTPLTPQTRHLINRAAIAKMKRAPLLINMARGPVVESDALLFALNSGAIRGAALDVTDPEPIPPNHPLVTHPNCVIIPHLGSATLEARTEMARIAAENLRKHVGARPKK